MRAPRKSFLKKNSRQEMGFLLKAVMSSPDAKTKECADEGFKDACFLFVLFSVFIVLIFYELFLNQNYHPPTNKKSSLRMIWKDDSYEVKGLSVLVQHPFFFSY